MRNLIKSGLICAASMLASVAFAQETPSLCKRNDNAVAVAAETRRDIFVTQNGAQRTPLVYGLVIYSDAKFTGGIARVRIINLQNRLLNVALTSDARLPVNIGPCSMQRNLLTKLSKIPAALGSSKQKNPDPTAGASVR